MKKYIIITVTALLILTSFFSGCTQENTNNNDISDEVELLSHNITTYENLSTPFKEVRGTAKNIGNRIINITVEVSFYNKDNVVLYTGTYTIYNFVNGITENFIVEFWSTDQNYNDYDHYSIKLIYE